MKKDKSSNENYFYIVKFDLLLYYYILFNYHKDLSDIEESIAFN